MTRLFLVVLLLSFVVPGAAFAATVSVGDPPLDLLDRAVRYRAAGGETNQVTIVVSAMETTVRDTAASLTAGAGCLLVDAHTARCAAEFATPEPEVINAVVAELGDGDDAIGVTFPRSAEAFLTVDGGAGNDALDASRADITAPRSGPGVVLEGGAGRDRLEGGAGHDALLGGPGVDALRGGAGADELSGDGPGRPGPRGGDVLDGGAGTDVATYAERLRPVVVDLERGRGGRRGEADRLRAIEDVVGGRGRDVLRGDGGPNRLFGFQPDQTPRAGDVLVGRGGNDDLVGTVRGARFDGGRGNDVLRPFSRRDRLACGRGSDTLRELRNGVLVPRDCEWIDVQVHLVSRGTMRGGRAFFRVRRPPGVSGCAGTLSLRSPLGTVYGRVSWPARGRRNRRVSFRLTAAGQHAAARHRVAVVRSFERCADTAVVWRIRL